MKIECFKSSWLKAYVSLINRARADWPRHRDFTAEQIELMYFKNPNYNEKGHFLAILEDKLVGEAISFVDSQCNTEEGRSYGFLELSVLPEYRRRGIGKTLVKKVCEYLRKRNVKEVRTQVPEVCEGSKRFYEQLGFSICDKQFELAYNMQKGVPNLKPPSGYVERVPEFPREKTQFLEVWNKSFAESEGSSSLMTPEAFEDFLHYPGIESSYFVVEREIDGDIVGIITNYIDLAYNKRNNVKEGTIEIVGVLSRERKKGIGASLVSKSLKWMKTKGISTVLVYIYSENSASLRLFQSLGFDVIRADSVYKLPI